MHRKDTCTSRENEIISAQARGFERDCMRAWGEGQATRVVEGQESAKLEIISRHEQGISDVEETSSHYPTELVRSLSDVYQCSTQVW